MKVASVRISATKEQLLNALKQDQEDRAAVLYFLLGAEREGLILQGNHASDAVAATARLLRIPNDNLDILRKTLA